MSKPIIVGYDPQSSDRAPVDFAVAAARFTGAPLIVASVGAGSSARRRGGTSRVHEDLIADAAESLEEVKANVGAEGVSARYRALDSTSAARALHEEAVANDAGLLVVGSTRRGAIGRVLPGSTAERLMHGAPCAIAIVPHEWQAGGGLHMVGVAYADTDEGREALRGAHALARRAGAKLRVLTATKAGITEYGETEAGTDVRSGIGLSDIEGELRVRTEDELRDAAAALDGGVEVQVDAFVEEDPADVLIRVSENLDVLVCGSRGYGPARAVLLGGVSRRLAADAHCPVIVLPRGVEDALEAL